MEKPPGQPPNNYAFIDTQNIYLGVRDLGWELDWAAFRQHLKGTYGVSVAYLFIGEQPQHRGMYAARQAQGYQLVFKEVVYDRTGKAKGNVDAELVLQTMIDYHHARYDQAVIVTSDGDFACLVRYLRDQGNLRAVLSPSKAKASALLKKAARGRLDTLAPLRDRLEHKK